MTSNRIQLPIGQYRFHFKAEENILLPAYSGSSWRGIFGHQLKRTVCVTREQHCKDCMLWRNCAYTYLFETPPALDAVMMKKYTAAPHPFIIQPNPQQQRNVQAGENLFIDIQLIGKANQYLPYFIHSFQQAGKRGIGRNNSRFSLINIEQKQQQQFTPIFNTSDNQLQALAVKAIEIPPLPDSNIILAFITPYRTRSNNKYIHAESFNFYHLFSPLSRRLSSLSYFHNDHELSHDFRQLNQNAKKVSPIKQRLKWHDWKRYSSRQQTEIKMGGIIGTLIFTPQSINEFWSFLYLGQYINVGKGTVMGLGKYTLHD